MDNNFGQNNPNDNDIIDLRENESNQFVDPNFVMNDYNQQNQQNQQYVNNNYNQQNQQYMDNNMNQQNQQYVNNNMNQPNQQYMNNNMNQPNQQYMNSNMNQPNQQYMDNNMNQQQGYMNNNQQGNYSQPQNQQYMQQNGQNNMQVPMQQGAQSGVPVNTQLNNNFTEEETDLIYANLDPQQQNMVNQIINGFEIENSESVLGYAVSVQMKLAEFSDRILESVKGNDVDAEVADLLTDLAVEIKHFDSVAGGDEKKGFLSGFLGGINKGQRKISDTKNNMSDQIKYQVALSKKETDKLKVRYENISQTMNEIEKKLDDAKVGLIRNVTVMNQMYDKNLNYYKELSLYIIAGKEKLKQFGQQLEQQKLLATQTNSQMEIQKLNEMIDLNDKFERKIDDLIKSRIISIQNAPQIRLVQRSSEQLIYSIQNSVLTAIPIWKSQMVISLGISSNKTAMGLQQHISDTTNQLLIKNSELLKQGTLDIAEQTEKGLVSVEALKITNENLIDTIYGVIEVQERGKENRKVAEQEIIKLEGELKQALKGDGSRPQRVQDKGGNNNFLNNN